MFPPTNENCTSPTSPKSRAKAHVQAGLATIGTALQKINLPKFLDNATKEEELQKQAQKQAERQREAEEEAERQRIVEEALAKCQAEIKEHLSTFLFLNPTATYEEWVQDLHPENVVDGKLLTDFKDVDLRFYVADSDHRLLWNAHVPPERQVASRTYRSQSKEMVDLLNNSFTVPRVDTAVVDTAVTEPTLEAATGSQNPSSDNNRHDNQLVDLLDDGWP